MADRNIRQDEIQRQRVRLEGEIVSRQLGVALAFVIFGFFLPFWVVFLTYLVCVATEFSQHHLMVEYEKKPTAGRHMAILANSALGLSAFSLPAIFLWQNPESLVKVIGVLSLVGALLNVAIVRSAHLAMGLTSGLPPALVLLSLPLRSITHSSMSQSALLATGAAIVLIGYFISALRQNHRMQGELLSAVETAKGASRAKSRFLAAMSHEVRTPLNAILGHSEMMRGETGAEAVRSHAAAVEAAARGMQMMVEDVIDLASVTEGEVRFTPMTAVIRRELEAINAMKWPINTETSPEISIEIAPEVPEFGRFDPLLLRKCLNHLGAVVLAGQSSARQPRLDIRCALAPGRKDRLRVTLAGREAARQEDTAPETGQPESLAMTLVNHIAEVMGARAAVLRAPGGSLVARIELPFVMVADPPDTGAETVYGKLHALVVDDISTNRFVVVQMLRALRIEAEEAAGGGDALQRLASDDFDLVLLDMNMPDMDGEATFREIRNSGAEWAAIPVLALTADSITYQRDHYLGLGLNGYVSKPVDRRLLWAEILAAVPPPPPL